MLSNRGEVNLGDSIITLLQKGKENAITGKSLAGLLGMRDTRIIRQTILELIAGGFPICSSPHEPYGYYFAGSKDEVDEALRVLRSYGKNIFVHYRDLKRARDSVFCNPDVVQLSLELKVETITLPRSIAKSVLGVVK